MRCWIGFFVMMLLVGPMVLGDVASGEKNLTDSIKIGDKLEALGGGLDERTENVLDREIPEGLQVPSRFFFGMEKGSSNTIEEFIILLAFWIGIFGLIKISLEMSPVFNKGMQNIVASIIITIIIGMTGAIRESAMFFLDFLDLDFLNAMGSFKIVFSIMIACIILFFFYGVINMMKKKMRIARAEEFGNRMKTLNRIGEITEENIKELNKK